MKMSGKLMYPLSPRRRLIATFSFFSSSRRFMVCRTAGSPHCRPTAGRQYGVGLSFDVLRHEVQVTLTATVLGPLVDRLGEPLQAKSERGDIERFAFWNFVFPG